MRDPMKQAPQFTRDDVQIRPVKEQDRDPILQISSQIWDGEDYLPQVFNEWLSDNVGTFNVMTYKGQVVGVGKLSKLSEGEWWLEGLRVDPAYQGRGLARIMHHYIVAQARRMADGVLRFSTSSANESVLKLALETGFRISGHFKSFEAEARPVEKVTWWQLGEGDFSKAQKWLSQSDYFMAARQSFEHRWKWRLATETGLHQYLRDGLIYGWNPEGHLDTVNGLMVVNPFHQDDDDDTRDLRFGYGDAHAEDRVKFWKDALGLAATLGAKTAQVKVIDVPQYTAPLIEAGWKIGEAHPVLVSRPLVLTIETEVLHEKIPALE